MLRYYKDKDLVCVSILLDILHNSFPCPVLLPLALPIFLKIKFYIRVAEATTEQKHKILKVKTLIQRKGAETQRRRAEKGKNTFSFASPRLCVDFFVNSR